MNCSSCLSPGHAGTWVPHQSKQTKAYGKWELGLLRSLLEGPSVSVFLWWCMLHKHQ